MPPGNSNHPGPRPSSPTIVQSSGWPWVCQKKVSPHHPSHPHPYTVIPADNLTISTCTLPISTHQTSLELSILMRHSSDLQCAN